MGVSAPAETTVPALEAQRVEISPVAPAVSEASERLAVSPRARKLAIEKKVDLSQVKATGGDWARIVEQDVLAYLSQLPKASPLAQKVAADSGVDLGILTGSGPGGRIMKTDVERSIRVEAPAPAPQALPPAGEAEVIDRVPLSGVRAIIAERMGTSVHTTARVTLVSEVDATEFVAMRERIRIKGEIQTLTAQQKLTGIVLGLIPVGCGLLFEIMSPGYINPLFTTFMGKVMLSIAVVMEVIGIMIIQRILKIEV